MNPFQMMQQFNQFKNNFRGNPQTEVERLISSGQMSQEQFEQFRSMANQIEQMAMGIKNH